jgi:transcriptional regulator with XRE-family HTH domain
MNAETPADRLKRARQAVGLDEHAVAQLVGISSPAYYDLEGHQHELAQSLSLETLCHLGEVAKVDPLVLLIGDRGSSVERSIQFEDVVQQLTEQMAALGLDAERFGARVGWDVTKILADPQELWELNSDGFVDIAEGAGLKWTSAFPRTRRRAGPT